MIVPVKTDTWNYDIVLEPGAIKKAGELLNLNRRVLVVTDSGVPRSTPRPLPRSAARRRS